MLTVYKYMRKADSRKIHLVHLKMRLGIILVLLSIFNTIAANCDGESLGTARTSNNTACPTGYVGKVIEICTKFSSSKDWLAIRQYCNPVSCGHSSVIGDTISYNCPSNYSGSLTLTCQNNGLWKVTSNNCVTNTEKCFNLGQYRFLTCGMNSKGLIIQQCQGSSPYNWANISGNCTDLRCGALYIGDDSGTSTTNCGSSDYQGIAYQVCRYAINDSSTTITANGSLYSQYYGNCMPQYSTCSTANSTKSVTCPAYQISRDRLTLTHSQICSANNNWITNYNSLQADNCFNNSCNGYPQGYIRESLSKTCGKGRAGVVFEVCTDNGWYYSETNCTSY